MSFKKFFLKEMAFRAYHGTPHKISDKFSLKHVGTGEGNQAYGWGLYFTETLDVAKHYAKEVSGFRETEDQHVYTVEIDAFEFQLINWDLPFTQQSLYVKDRLTKLKEPIEKGLNYTGSGNETMETSTGGAIYYALKEAFSIPKDQGGLERTEYDQYSKPKNTSLLLLKTGIKGNVYKDAVSRRVGSDKSSHHFVIFDDSLIHIEK